MIYVNLLMITVLHQTLTDMLGCNLGNPFLDQLKKHIVLKDSDNIMALYNLLNTTVAANPSESRWEPD